MKIVILEEAEQDIKNALLFYEAQKEGLGSYFLDAIFADIESLYLYAGIHIVISGYHRLLAKRFPFAVYYKLKDKTIFVYAVLDCRRDPTWIKRRLEE